jgi:drug/metabolite transporter (DMT)-like permease
VGSYVVSDPHLESINIGDLISFASAFFAGTSILYLTQARKTESSIIIVFYLMLIGTFLNFPLVIDDLGLLSMDSAGIVLLAAGTGFLGQVFTTEGFKYVDSATGSMLSSSRMVMAAAIGYFFLAEPLNLRIVSGIILISIALFGVSGYGKVLREKFKNKISVE